MRLSHVHTRWRSTALGKSEDTIIVQQLVINSCSTTLTYENLDTWGSTTTDYEYYYIYTTTCSCARLLVGQRSTEQVEQTWT